MKDILVKRGAEALFGRLHALEPGLSEEEVVKKHWRSMVCESCAGCCHSSLVPISGKEIDSFYNRLDIAVNKEEFIAKFVSDPNTKACNYTIRTKEYGGRCLFLAKEKFYACSVWGIRPEVCSDFFCWPMTQFALYDDSKRQEMFKENETWIKNFDLLFDKVLEEMTGSLFDDDMMSYIESQKSVDYPSYFEKECGKINSR